MIWVILAFLVLTAIGMPVAFAIGISGFIFFLITPDMLLTTPVQLTLTQTQNFAMLAIPLFVLAGNLLNETGITRRLMHFASALTGHLRAGLAHVNFTLAFMLGGVTSSAIGDATMLGRVLGPGMKERNYNAGFAAGIIGSASIITTMVPPGTGMILYGTIGEVSIGRLFTAGIIPGILITLVLMLAVAYTARKQNYPPERPRRAPLKEVARAGMSSIWALLFPVILIVGLRFGYFTPSEAGAFAVAYALIVGIIAYRELTWERFATAVADTAVDVGMIMLLIGMSGGWGYGLTWDRVPQTLLSVLTGISENPVLIMLILVLALLVIGMFMDSTVLILLLTPMLVPVAERVGVDPIQFGIVMILTLTLGLLTPPVGIVMFIVNGMFNASLPSYLKNSALMFLGLLATVVLIILIPELTLWLPNLLYGT